MPNVHESLWCLLDDEELLVRGQMLSDCSQQYELVEKQKKDTMKEFGEQLGELRSTRIGLAQAIKDKREKRLVECVVMYHSPVQGTKRFTRLDTGEFVRDEPMSASEMQQNLFAPDPPPTSPGGPPNGFDGELLVREMAKDSTGILQKQADESGNTMTIRVGGENIAEFKPRSNKKRA